MTKVERISGEEMVSWMPIVRDGMTAGHRDAAGLGADYVSFKGKWIKVAEWRWERGQPRHFQLQRDGAFAEDYSIRISADHLDLLRALEAKHEGVAG